uniref:Uncharacterized protein n=1 Tax=Arundo donax TaxID=35708 RepID=A0A0A8ZBC4_ARUDO
MAFVGTNAETEDPGHAIFYTLLPHLSFFNVPHMTISLNKFVGEHNPRFTLLF